MKNADVVVVGGGVVGAAAAYQLSRQGVHVIRVDAERVGQATAAGAGIVAPGSSFLAPSAHYPISYLAAAYYPTLIRQLQEDEAGDTGYEVRGALLVATSVAEADRLPYVWRLLEERRGSGVPNIGELARLSPAEARDLFPLLGSIEAAIYMSGAVRLDGRRLRDALTHAAVGRGLKIVVGEAMLACHQDAVSGVVVDGEEIGADVVIWAGGAWTSELSQLAGVEVPVVPQKGQILHLEMSEDTSQWPIVEGFHSHYMLTFPEHRVVVGATREDNSGFDTRLTAGGVLEVLQEATRVAPGLHTGRIVDMRVGLRPATIDKLPILGSVPGVKGLYVATAHGANGLTAGPYSGVQVANMVLARPVELDFRPYSLTRF